jgi:hypothetical protein
MLILIEPRSFWKNRELEMTSSDPSGFALDVGRAMLVSLLPVGSVGVKMMQRQRHALEKTKGFDPVESSPRRVHLRGVGEGTGRGEASGEDGNGSDRKEDGVVGAL